MEKSVTTIELQNFEIDCSSTARVEATRNGKTIMILDFDFASGPDNEQHTITTSLHENLSHYDQTYIMFEASLMIDSHFDPDVETPYSEKNLHCINERR